MGIDSGRIPNWHANRVVPFNMTGKWLVDKQSWTKVNLLRHLKIRFNDKRSDNHAGFDTEVG